MICVVVDGSCLCAVSQTDLPLLGGGSSEGILLCRRPPEADGVLSSDSQAVDGLGDRTDLVSTIGADKANALIAAVAIVCLFIGLASCN